MSQSKNIDANQVIEALVQYKSCFEFLKSLLLCWCPFEDIFILSFSQLIQRPCDVTEDKYESSIEIHQTKKTSQFMNVLRNGTIFEDIYLLWVDMNACRVNYIPQILDAGHRK